jgi:Mn-dependent DtxR family transcriptional regulator
MALSDRSDLEASLLRVIHEEGLVDLYDLAQAVGAGPRAVQEAVGTLAEDGLVYVTDRSVRCSREGEALVRGRR